MISVFGGTGFIGGRFVSKYQNQCSVIPKNSNATTSNNVLYFISTTHNYNIFDDYHLDINTNLTKLVDVLDGCARNENLTFNFVSSWFVYGKNNTLPLKEDAYCDPKGMYSITKRAAEQVVVTYAETFGFNYRILRLCNIIGEGDWKNACRRKNALQYMIGEVLDDKDVQLYENGDCIRDFMYVDDAVDAIKLVVDQGPVNDIINISNGDPRTIGSIIRGVKEKYNTKGNIQSIATPQFHKTVQIKDAYLDNSKLLSLGYKSKVSFDESIDRIVNSYHEYKATNKKSR